ncbi:MAG: ATP-binding protein [Nanobdellota archaeon]
MNIKSKIILFALFLTSLVTSVIVFLLENEFTRIGNNSFFIVILILLIFVIFVTFIFAYVILKPVDDLVLASQLLAAGRYEKGLLKKSNDEFGRMIDTFNSMSKKIKNTVAKTKYLSDIAAQEKCKTNHIIDSMTEGVIVTDVDYKVVHFNTMAEQMFKLDEVKVKNKHILHVFEAFGMREAVSKFPELDKHNVLPMKDINPTIFEQEVEKPKKMILKISIAPVLNDKKFPAGTVTVIDDITRLREIDKMKSEFVSNVSHELRTPLTSILGYTYVLLNNKAGDLNDTQIKYLHNVENESKRLSDIIEDILDLSRLESDKAKMKFEKVDLRGILNNCQAINFTAKKGIKFEVLCPKTLPQVMGDRIKLTQVFNNLISNAVKFTIRGGKITVKFSNKKDCLRVDVIDTGIGVKKSNIGNLFNKFYQVKSNLTNKEKGTGLGLSIVKEIIAAHYGLLGVDSKYGKGTRISFTIPKRQTKRDLQIPKCWEHLNCGKKKCPQYKIDDEKCWINLGTFCKKNKNEPCFDKIKICSYCDIYTKMFEEVNQDEKEENSYS